MPANGRGSLQTVIDELVLLGEQLQALFPELHVFDWWRPDLPTPCVFHWLTTSSHETPPDTCTSRDTLRITVSIAVDPRSTVAEDAAQLMTYGDAALDLYDAALAARRPLGGQQAAKRTGLQTVSDRWGDTPVLVLELPVEITLDRPLNVS